MSVVVYKHQFNVDLEESKDNVYLRKVSKSGKQSVCPW